MTSDGYALADVAFEPERERLDILESLNDPASVAWLTRLGISEGWRCLDVGAGGGSVARWMAERVGANGTVVAADMDTRFLRALDLPNVEIRQLDILEDDIETDHYDLVHARFLLMHVSSPERALANMVAAIKPGGWLLVEDGDYTNFAAVDRDHALSAVFDATFRKEMAYYVASLQLDPLIGRKLPALVKRLELSDVDHEDKNWVRAGGGDIGKYWETLLRSFQDDEFLRGAGISEADFEKQIQAFNDPSFRFADMAVFAAWGRKPEA